MGIFEKIIKNINTNFIEHLITPLAPYFMCNHFISTEVTSGRKFVKYELSLKANNLLKNKNYHSIKNFDIIQIQVDHFNFFYDKVLPIIEKKNIKVIIITSQWYLPQIKKTPKVMKCLNNNHILLWISQNPIFKNHPKYMEFPYGLLHTTLNDYVNFVKVDNETQSTKNIKILNQYSSAYHHFPANHIRKVYPIFGKKSGTRLKYDEYLTNISNAEFVISTTGDRDDCYRHYECIGLNAIPVSNASIMYRNIFEKNMIFSKPEPMVNMVTNETINIEYYKPNRDILTILYWRKKIKQKANQLKRLD